MATKLVLRLAETQATPERIAESLAELAAALKDQDGISPAQAEALDIEVTGTLAPSVQAHVVADSDLVLLCSAFGVQRQPNETAHQVIHRIAGLRQRQGTG